MHIVNTGSSPSLKLKVERGLSELFKRASISGYFKGIDYGNELYLSHLQYADDTLVFVHNNYSSLMNVKRILRWFELSSGLKFIFLKAL